MEKLVKLKPSGLLKNCREKCADHVPFEHEKDDEGPVEIYELMPDFLFRKGVRHAMKITRRGRS